MGRVQGGARAAFATPSGHLPFLNLLLPSNS